MPDFPHRVLVALLAAFMLLAASLLRETARAEEDPCTPLYSAVYVSARDVLAEVPCGQFSINDGIVCFLPGQDKRKEGMFIGDLDLELSRLPKGDDVLNVFAQQAVARGDHEPRTLLFEVNAAYVNASLESDSTVLPGGRAVTIRSWEDLDSDEQEQFRQLFLAGLERGWRTETDDSAKRDPRGREFFATFWCDEQEQGEACRYDFRVDESGKSLAIEDAKTDQELYRAENLTDPQ